MDELRCPHCDKEIQLLDKRDLQRIYSVGINTIDQRLKDEIIPEPALGGPSPKKFYWLAADILASRMQLLEEEINNMTDDERAGLQRILSKQKK